MPSASSEIRHGDDSFQASHPGPSRTEHSPGQSLITHTFAIAEPAAIAEYAQVGFSRQPGYHPQGGRCRVTYRNDHVTTVSTISEIDDRTNLAPATPMGSRQTHRPQLTYENYDDYDDERQSPASIRTQYGIPESAGTLSENGQNAAVEDITHPTFGHSDDEFYQHSTEVVSVLNISSDEESDDEISNRSCRQAVNELYDNEVNNENILPPNAGFDVVEVRDIQQDAEEGESDHNDGSNNAERSDDDQTIQKMKKGQNKQKGKDIKEDYQEPTNVEILIIADLVLKEMKNDSIAKKKCYVHIQNDLDFNNASSVGCSLPRFPKLKSVFLHCGFRHVKKGVDKFLKEKIKETINSLDDQFSEANIVLSAVLPFRGNKNRAKIDQLNMTIEDICHDTSAEFEDFTFALMDADTGKVNKNMYLDTVSLSKKGSERIAQSITHKLKTTLLSVIMT